MKALCLGGGVWQVDLIRRARELGVSTLVADINPNCPGRADADEFVRVDTSDRDAVLAVARGHRVDLVLAEQTDRVVPVAAFVNEALGLPGLRPAVAERFTNKLAMRQALRGKVPMPAFAEVASPADVRAFGDREGWPVILKPKQSQSSMGVFKIADADAIEARFAESLALSTDGRLLVETFVAGTEITVEGFSAHGRSHVLAVSEKAHYEFNDCVARRLSYPPRFPEDLMRRIEETGDTVVETLGLEDGISHAEYRVRDDVPHLVEVAARGGGNRIASRIVPHVSGVDVYEALLRRLQGKTVDFEGIRRRAAVLEFLDFAPGRVKAVHGVERVESEGLAQELQLAFKAGDTIARPNDDRQRLGFAIILGENRDDVDARAARIRDLVRVEYA